MSANLGALLKCLDPNLKIELYEVTDELSKESSNGWNNAGTGHAGICELSYTPDRGPDGEVDVSKAVEIFEQRLKTPYGEGEHRKKNQLVPWVGDAKGGEKGIVPFNHDVDSQSNQQGRG